MKKRAEITKVNNYHILWIDGYPWMWDFPQEAEMQRELAQEAEGDVLVAGYGLGLVQKYLFDNPRVTSVTSVELYQEVMDEAKNYFGIPYGDVVVCDFYTYQPAKKYDCVIGDIWPDIHERFLNDYLKFKRKSIALIKKNGKILAWGKLFFDYLENA